MLARRDELTLWTAPDAEDACDAEGAHQWPHQPWEGSESRYGVDDLRLGDGVFDALPLHRAASRRDQVAAPVRSIAEGERDDEAFGRCEHRHRRQVRAPRSPSAMADHAPDRYQAGARQRQQEGIERTSQGHEHSCPKSQTRVLCGSCDYCLSHRGHLPGADTGYSII